MYGDIENYFYKKIVPEFIDYLEFRENNIFANNNDTRIGLICANGLYHLREHLPESIKKSRNFFVGKCVDYSLLGDIVNVSKHKTINRNQPQITDLDNIQELLFITTYKDEKGEYQKIAKEVEINLDNGEKRLLSSILTNCINMWLDYLNANQIIEQKNYFVDSYKKAERPKDENFEMGGIQGLMFSKFKIQLRKYNYEKKVVEPIDITGADVKFRIYLPKDTKHYNIRIDLPNSNEKIDFEVILTDAEVEDLEKLDNEERCRELLKIAKKQGTI